MSLGILFAARARGVLSSRHFAVDLDLCPDRYCQLRAALCQNPLLPPTLSFPPLPQLDPPVDSAPRANDTVLLTLGRELNSSQKCFSCRQEGKASV